MGRIGIVLMAAWFSLDVLAAVPASSVSQSDGGYGIARFTTDLQKIPSVAGITLNQVPAGTKVKIIHYQDQWVFVQLKNDHRGFVRRTHLTIPQATRGVRHLSFLKSVPVRHRFSSPFPSITAGPSLQLPLEVKTSAQLFSQKIFDIVSSPIIPNLTFVSSNGIYRTIDGENWEKLEAFGDHNYPLAISPDGVVYVGARRSLDHGLSFQNYVHWDQLLSIIGSSHSVYLSQLKILKIDFGHSTRDRLVLTLQIGPRHYKIAGQESGSNWFLVSRNF